MHHVRDAPKLLAKMLVNSEEKIVDTSKNINKFFISYDYILEITGFTKKRFDLWLFRHKKVIFTIKFEKKKFVSLNILDYFPKLLRNQKK